MIVEIIIILLTSSSSQSKMFEYDLKKTIFIGFTRRNNNILKIFWIFFELGLNIFTFTFLKAKILNFFLVLKSNVFALKTKAISIILVCMRLLIFIK